jgi:hypothetical protein
VLRECEAHPQSKDPFSPAQLQSWRGVSITSVRILTLDPIEGCPTSRFARSGIPASSTTANFLKRSLECAIPSAILAVQLDQCDFSRTDKRMVQAHAITSQKANRLKSGRRVWGNSSWYVAVTSSPPRLHQNSLLPEGSFLVSRICMTISLHELTSAIATKIEKKTGNILLDNFSSRFKNNPFVNTLRNDRHECWHIR